MIVFPGDRPVPPDDCLTDVDALSGVDKLVKDVQAPLLAVADNKLFWNIRSAFIKMRGKCHCDPLTNRMFSPVERFDYPDPVGLDGPPHVDHVGVQPVEDCAPQDGQVDALRDDDLDPVPEGRPDVLLDYGGLGEAAHEEEVTDGGRVGQDAVNVLEREEKGGRIRILDILLSGFAALHFSSEGAPMKEPKIGPFVDLEEEEEPHSDSFRGAFSGFWMGLLKSQSALSGSLMMMMDSAKQSKISRLKGFQVGSN